MASSEKSTFWFCYDFTILKKLDLNKKGMASCSNKSHDVTTINQTPRCQASVSRINHQGLQTCVLGKAEFRCISLIYFHKKHD